MRDWNEWMRAESAPIEKALQEVLPARGGGPKALREAMRYALFPGGKRLRPALAVLAFRASGGRGDEVYRMAACLELVHTFTLIHDDLPCMDDDDFRRGRATCHRAHGEALAVLAGDALLNLAYETILRLRAPQARVMAVARTMAAAVGAAGVLGGQVEDISAEGREVAEESLRSIHERKTASLISASLRMGGELAGEDRQRHDRLARYGRELGLLFQIADDLLNLMGDEAILGRPGGSDERRGKATYPRVLGLEPSLERARACAASARRIATEFGPWEHTFLSLVEAVARRIPRAGKESKG